MNEQSYFHWDFFRPPIHSPSIQMGAPFLDIREDGMRGIPNKNKAFSLDQSCAFWSKDMGLDPSDGLQHVGGRVLEIRKEKSRDAARSRRGKENYEFYELAKLLPLPAAITSQLDKASIIRLSISYLKLRDFCGHGDPPWNRDSSHSNKSMKGGQRRRNPGSTTVDLFEIHQGAHILQSLDGFAFTLSADGRFLYISETVSIYLGLSQVEMAGSSIFDYVHAQDHQELADQLGLSLAGVTSTMSSPSSPSVDSPNSSRAITPPLTDRVPLMSPNLEKGEERTFCLRMKSTLTKRGAHTRSSGYRVVFISGRFRRQVNYGLNRKSQAPLLGLVGVAIALPPPTITELRIEADTFIMRLTSEFKIIYCENMISTLTDWRCEDLSGKELYEFCHPGDITGLKKVHSDLLVKGQVLSPSLRLLNKGGGYIWMVVCATSLYSSKSSDDPTFLAIFQTISSIEHRGVIMDANHLQGPISGAKPYPVDQEQERGSDDILVQSINSTSPYAPNRETLSQTSNCQLIRSPHSDPQESPGPPCHGHDFLLEENLDDNVKIDNKISRRKMDHPRKRKRECDKRRSLEEVIDSDIESSDCVDSSVNDNAEDSCDIILNLSSSHTVDTLPESPNAKRSANMTSPQLPEDLSFRATSHKDDMKNATNNQRDSNAIGSSVRELEKAMDRHLPQKSSTYSSCESEIVLRDMHNLQKSSSQWMGENSSASSSSETLSASAFLRHLYTSRESVIRSNGRPYCYSEMSAINMLTPPGSDICKEQLHLNIPHISTQNKSSYQSNKESVSMISSSSDDFNMTPPSSVSPQEKMTSPFHEVDVSTNECLRMRGNHNILSSVKINPFSTIVDGNDDMAKGHFLPVPNYNCQTSDITSFSHQATSTGSILYETRASASHSTWYSPSYHP